MKFCKYTYKNFIFLLLTILFLFMSQSLFAQYQVYYWADFEKGTFPPEAVPIGLSFNKRAAIVNLDLERNLPLEFRSTVAAKETGKYALKLTSLPVDTGNQKEPKDYITGIAFKVVLDRDKLGANGRALYQADFFVTEPAKKFPSLAVLAMGPLPPGDPTPKSFYRFGMTKSSWLYFSYVLIDSLEANVFKHDEKMHSQIPRPGWHRFAIVFEGRENIRFYIDGNELPFSPIQEPTLRKLQVGIMLADPDDTYSCYIDNASIQWTPQDVPLPDSPYAPTWKGYIPPPTTNIVSAPKTTKTQAPTGQASQGQSAPVNITWLEPNVAWENSLSSSKPMLIYFHAPRIKATLNLNTLIETNPTAKSYLSKYSLAKIDVNQLQGGKYAERFNIFKIPTFIVLDKSGKEVARAIFKQNDTWETFIAQLNM